MGRLLFRPLAWLLDAPLADAIVGDLEEGWHRRATRSPLRASVWFFRAGLGVLLHAATQRLREWLADGVSSRGGSRGLGGDMNHAVRSLRRNPAFAAAAVILLALGIGANTAVFSVVRAVLLRPLPYDRPESLVFLWDGHETRTGNLHDPMTSTHVREIGRHNTTLESYAAFKLWNGGLEGKIDLLGTDGTERLRGAVVTPNFFEVLGVAAAEGRVFASTDVDALPLAVISHDLWHRRFAADPRIVGREVRLARGSTRTPRAHVIIGVLPEDVRLTYPERTDLYVAMPWTALAQSHPRAKEYGVVARLKRGVAVGQAEAELTAVSQNITRSYGAPPEFLAAALARSTIMVEPVTDHMLTEVRPGVLLLAGVAGLVLLIACVNLGLLMLARTVDRGGELAVRAALGAGPRRILRLLAAEGAVLALVGGTAGVLFAFMAQPMVRALMPPVVPRIEEIGVDLLVLLFALGVTTLTAVVCGIVPGLVAMRRDLLAAVRRDAGTSTSDRLIASSRRAVVGLQVAVVLVLLVGAGLLLHSFWRIHNVPLGFDADGVITIEMRLLGEKYRSASRMAAFQTELLDAVRQLPGVERVGLTTAVPMRGTDFRRPVAPKNQQPQVAFQRYVDPEYFGILRIPLKAGRTFTRDDRAGAAPVVVISESLARRHFGQTSPLGARLMIQKTEAEIIGVVGDVRYAQVVADAAPAFYVPAAQFPAELMCLVIKPQPGMRAAVSQALRTAVQTIDPEQPVEGLTTLEDIVAKSTADRRFYAVATAAFAGVALLLATAGLFGVVSRSVTERRREFAIRAALGADARRLVRLVIRAGLVPVVCGAVAGLAVAHAGSRVLDGFLFEVAPTDPLTYSGAAALVLLVAAAACFAPALRVVRMQPMAALKND